MMTSARAFLIASLMISCTSWATVEDIVTIKPKHRLAEDIAALVRPSLESGETVITGSGLLIIKATPDHIDKIRNLVQQLDTPQRRLLITVAQGRGLTTEELGASFGGRREGLKGHIYQTDTQGLGQQIQRIQTMDGQSARIDFGEQIAVPTQNLYGYGPYGTVVGQSSEYQNLTSGFAVTPRTMGQRVTLEVAPWSNRLSRHGDGSIDTQSAQTTLQSTLGEWVEVGGQIDSHTVDDSTVLGHKYGTRSDNHRIFIKVDQYDDVIPTN